MDTTEIQKALQHLKKDEKMRGLIAKNPTPTFTRGKGAYSALVRAIIYQQLSGKAAGTILKRFLALYGGKSPTPTAVLSTSQSAMRSVGLSRQKVEYLKDLSRKFEDGTISPRHFSKMSDEEIRGHLIAVKGVGRWTADMFLMFFLNRPDVLPTGDLAIQKGFQKLYALKSLPDAKKMETLAKPWKPYRTVASWYLWRIIDSDTEGTDW